MNLTSSHPHRENHPPPPSPRGVGDESQSRKSHPWGSPSHTHILNMPCRVPLCRLARRQQPSLLEADNELLLSSTCTVHYNMTFMSGRDVYLEQHMLCGPLNAREHRFSFSWLSATNCAIIAWRSQDQSLFMSTLQAQKQICSLCNTACVQRDALGDSCANVVCKCLYCIWLFLQHNRQLYTHGHGCMCSHVHANWQTDTQ